MSNAIRFTSDTNTSHEFTSHPDQFVRKRSLVRPDRERMDPNHRLYNYKEHALAMESEGRGATATVTTNNLQRGQSILARDEGEEELLPSSRRQRAQQAKAEEEGIIGPWMLYVYIVTFCCQGPILRMFGLRTRERQLAFREKCGLLAIILALMAIVGFLTFGFTQAVCGTPPNRYKAYSLGGGSMIFHGYDYDMDKFIHPPAPGIQNGTNPLYDNFNAARMDGSFLFQNVNQHCLNVITPAASSQILHSGNSMGWYFPCNLFNQYGTSAVNQTAYGTGTMCHTIHPRAIEQFKEIKPEGQIYYTWHGVQNESRNLGVYDGNVLDFSLLNWLDTTQVSYPAIFDTMKTRNDVYSGKDITALMARRNELDVAECLVDTIRVGFVSSTSIGCIASDVVLYVSLVVILGVVIFRFLSAVIFGWFLSWRIGRYPKETYEQRRARALEIENWTDDIYRPAPAAYRPTVVPPPTGTHTRAYSAQGTGTFLPTTSRFSKSDLLANPAHIAPVGYSASPYGSLPRVGTQARLSTLTEPGRGACPLPLAPGVVPQPPASFEPFNYPLIHSFMLVTAYSESVEGLRTTLDSLATSNYPNSHKVILVIADGMVKGSGNNLTTPAICLGMMKDFVVEPEDTDALSYVSLADGHKRHNKAKVFAGFYDYDDDTVERSKQQRVPMILVAKVGNDSEVNDPKPGNRGKRDSQIIIMQLLQKVMFDERLAPLEYAFFNLLWRVSGVSADRYELMLCVDADTKIFPDSMSRMIACMSADNDIVALCGETKIANKTQSWVTMIQVFEYYISHHLTKAYESMFGCVTCLPGCFSMYRIKAPKGPDGYWVPIMANPDIVEHYSENIVNTLHQKNLLLLGEDRYLTTLLLKTFPRRKLMFCPQAVCKTVVPETFRVLLSQRRRWINSTIHNLFELIIVPDLCGVFCFSMRFSIFMELVGTLVLPAALAFTLYIIVISIIPGTTKPIISLVLLGVILGIPAVLIVITSKRFVYVLWMLVYLASLPIWNFLLPAYAFLHMDDFSWGATRKVDGAKKGDAHGDKEGEFDSSHIPMKRWAEWERDRRYEESLKRPAPSEEPTASESSHLHVATLNPNASFVSTDSYVSWGQNAYQNQQATPSQPSLASFDTSSRPSLVHPQIELPSPLYNADSSATNITRGVSLSDDGPVPSPVDHNVRLVQRRSRRISNNS